MQAEKLYSCDQWMVYKQKGYCETLIDQIQLSKLESLLESEVDAVDTLLKKIWVKK